MSEWYKTKDRQAPNGREVLLSRGKDAFVGTYNEETDFFCDSDGHFLPTPKYWSIINPPEIEFLTITQWRKKYDMDSGDK